MMLPRKRQRPNPAEASSASLPATSVQPDMGPSTPTRSSSASASGVPTSLDLLQPSSQRRAERGQPSSSQGPYKQVRKAQSWYGSWPRTPKASASTSVIRENVVGGTVRSNRGPDFSRFETKNGDDSASVRSNSESGPALSKITEIGPADTTMSEDHGSSKPKAEGGDKESAQTTNVADHPANATVEAPVTPQRPSTSSGWLGWWPRTPFTETQFGSPPPPLPDHVRENTLESDQSEQPRVDAETKPSEAAATLAHPEPPASASWFTFWSVSAAAAESVDSKNQGTAEQPDDARDVHMEDAPQELPEPELKPEPAPKAGSTWAFWSRDSPKTNGQLLNPESGQIAVIGEGSEDHPKPMIEGDVSGSPSKKPRGDLGIKESSVSSNKSTWRKNKRLRPPSMDIDPTSPSSGSESHSKQAPKTGQVEPQLTPDTNKPEPSTKSATGSESVSKATPNLLLPSFSSTYKMKENPSIVKQITQFLLRTSQPPANHVFRISDPPKIRKALAIGVHGLFPATYLRPMIGQPTGTSLRFANLGAEAIRRWADQHGSPDCEIEKVALEGEGKIGDRVDNLWKLMLNWIEHIRSADLIIMASHSQGVPVSIMLLEKLIDLGIITDAKIGICAMAGVSLGPFPDYKSGILMGSAAELWEFGNPESANSQRLEAALKNVLNYGVRVTFIGSIDDQVVPMESAVYSPANHPYIFRAAFIDSRVNAPDFVAHLVGFALKLRNLGISDHGLIRELSVPLAGSLYSGEGHSRLYYDDAVYDLAVSHALETTAVTQPPLSEIVGRREALNATTPNPYLLPWIMRGLLEEDFVKTELSRETEELLRQFDDWKPTNKALKDVKYRLEAVRSKL